MDAIRKSKTLRSRAEEMFNGMGFDLHRRKGLIEITNENGNCINVWTDENCYDNDIVDVTAEIHLALTVLMKEEGMM